MKKTALKGIIDKEVKGSIISQIEIGVYDDRIEVKSTGDLLNGQTVDDLINLRTIGRRNNTL